MEAQGWHGDPSGVHDERWFSAGRPTPLVRDHGVVSREDLPPEEQPGRRPPEVVAARAVRDTRQAEPFDLPYRTIAWPCLIALAAAGLIVAWSAAAQPTSTFELAASAAAWVQADRAVQVAASLAAAALLIAAVRRPRWRLAIALTVWCILPLQIGLFLVSRAEYPGNSCTAQPGWAAITLSDTYPGPVVTAPPGMHVVVTVPPSFSGPESDVQADSGILQEDCTITLGGGGRRTIFTALNPGSTGLGSQSPDDSPASAPAWGGRVLVRGARD